MVNPQTPGLQMTHHLERGRVASDHTLFQSLYAPFFPPFSKGDKDRSGLVPWAKAKVPDRYPEELSPLWLSFSQDEQKENGDSEEIIALSLPPPHFPLFSLSPSPSLSFFFYFLVLWHLRLWQSMAGKTDKVMGKLYLYWCCMITLFIVNVL